MSKVQLSERWACSREMRAIHGVSKSWNVNSSHASMGSASCMHACMHAQRMESELCCLAIYLSTLAHSSQIHPPEHPGKGKERRRGKLGGGGGVQAWWPMRAIPCC
jgi:hypothetical protein